ncbi:MAG: hypothetical protein H0X39_12780 [Actinobacteria bacterium]|nr:hypothetical protein [Actinomycetota bacterium]
MGHPKDVGDRSTLAIMLAFQARGHGVFLPFGENTRIDLLVDYGNRISRVQCKTGRLRGGAVRFNTCSSYAHHSSATITKRTYAGEIDEFAVYCPELGSVYVVPITDVPTKRMAMLRVNAPRNNQRSGVRLAAVYEIGCVEVSAGGPIAGPDGPPGG